MISIVWHTERLSPLTTAPLSSSWLYMARKLFSMVTSATVKWRRADSSRDDQQALVDETWWRGALASLFRDGAVEAPRSFSDGAWGNKPAAAASSSMRYLLPHSTYSLPVLAPKRTTPICYWGNPQSQSKYIHILGYLPSRTNACDDIYMF